MKSAYDELYTVDMGRGELVYLGTKLVPPRNARSDIEESAHQGHFSPETIYNDLPKQCSSLWKQKQKLANNVRHIKS